MARGAEIVTSFAVDAIDIVNTSGTDSRPDLNDVYDAPSGKRYRFVQMHTVLINDVTANGEVHGYLSGSTTVTTQDASATIDGGNYPKGVGIALGAVPETTASITYYGWLQVSGQHAAAKTDTSTIAGAGLRMGTVDTELLGVVADGDARVAMSRVAWALTDDVAGVTPVMCWFPC